MQVCKLILLHIFTSLLRYFLFHLVINFLFDPGEVSIGEWLLPPQKSIIDLKNSGFEVNDFNIHSNINYFVWF